MSGQCDDSDLDPNHGGNGDADRPDRPSPRPTLPIPPDTSPWDDPVPAFPDPDSIPDSDLPERN